MAQLLFNQQERDGHRQARRGAVDVFRKVVGYFSRGKGRRWGPALVTPSSSSRIETYSSRKESTTQLNEWLHADNEKWERKNTREKNKVALYPIRNVGGRMIQDFWTCSITIHAWLSDLISLASSRAGQISTG